MNSSSDDDSDEDSDEDSDDDSDEDSDGTSFSTTSSTLLICLHWLISCTILASYTDDDVEYNNGWPEDSLGSVQSTEASVL